MTDQAALPVAAAAKRSCRCDCDGAGGRWLSTLDLK